MSSKKYWSRGLAVTLAAAVIATSNADIALAANVQAGGKRLRALRQTQIKITRSAPRSLLISTA